MSKEFRTISRLAKEAGVHVETIRYYERRGILQQPPKPRRGWRTYDDDALEVLRFVKRAQRLGFRLDEIEELLSLRESTEEGAGHRVRQHMEAKLQETREKLAELETVRDKLEQLSGLCAPEQRGPDCRALNELATGPF